MSLLEQDTMKKWQVDNTLPELKKDLEFEAEDSKKYEVKAIINSIVYDQKANNYN